VANVEGRLRTRSYEKDGQKHYVTEIIAQRVQFLGRKPNGGVTDIDHALPAEEEA
jgi:single-strand DNA-binding protein